MPLNKISRGFRDISLSFKRHPVTRDLLPLKNEDAIKKSVINLCRTRLTERFFNDTLGTSIEGYMFELADDEISGPIEEEVKTLLNGMEFDVAKEMIKSGIETLNSCLLYTSPSPRDLSTSRMPSSA